MIIRSASIPMPDGVRLAATLYLPAGERSWERRFRRDGHWSARPACLPTARLATPNG